MFLRPLELLRFKEWRATEKENEEAYRFINELLKDSRYAAMVWGEMGGFRYKELIGVLRQAVKIGMPRIELCCTSDDVREKLEQVEDKKEQLRMMLREVFARIPESEWREDVKTAMKKSVLKIFFVRKDLPGPHFMIIDGKHLYLQRIHPTGETKAMWFIWNAFFLRRKYKREFDKLKKLAVPLHESIDLLQEGEDAE